MYSYRFQFEKHKITNEMAIEFIVKSFKEHYRKNGYYTAMGNWHRIKKKRFLPITNEIVRTFSGRYSDHALSSPPPPMEAIIVCSPDNKGITAVYFHEDSEVIYKQLLAPLITRMITNE